MSKKIAAIAIAITILLSGCVSTPASYMPAGYAQDRCGRDETAPEHWRKVQHFMTLISECVSPVQIIKAELPDLVPASELDPNEKFLDADECKIIRQAKMGSWTGWPSERDKEYFERKRFPSPKTVFQVLPIYAPDTGKPTGKPSKDYKEYFEFVEEYFEYISDGPGDIEFRIPDEYSALGAPLAEFGVDHDQQRDTSRFANKLVEIFDEKIDFTDVDYNVVLAPLDTGADIITMAGFYEMKTKEGVIVNNTTYPSKKFKNNRGGNGMLPMMWLHEFYHPGLDLGDQDSRDPGTSPTRSMGTWGLMATAGTDLLTLHKWLLGFTLDSQVRCVSGGQSATAWLVPSSVKSTLPKLMVIKLSDTKAIYIESIRAKSVNYKLSSMSQGALVYTVDQEIKGAREPYLAFYPDGRPWARTSQNMSEAPLRLGESVSIEGVKITNVEWGDFGDVIKVEPVK